MIGLPDTRVKQSQSTTTKPRHIRPNPCTREQWSTTASQKEMQTQLGSADEIRWKLSTFSYGLQHMDTSELTDQEKSIFFNSAWTLDAVYGTYQEQWLIGTVSESQKNPCYQQNLMMMMNCCLMAYFLLFFFFFFFYLFFFFFLSNGTSTFVICLMLKPSL